MLLPYMWNSESWFWGPPKSQRGIGRGYMWNFLDSESWSCWTTGFSGVHPYKSDSERYKIWIYGDRFAPQARPIFRGTSVQIRFWELGGTKYGSMDRSALLELEGTKYEVQIRLWELEGYSTKLRYKLDSEIWELEPRGSVHNIDKIGGTNHSVQCKINLSHSEAATVHVLGKYTRTCYYRTCGILRADFEGRQNLPEGYM